MHKVRRQFWLLLILAAIFLLAWAFSGQRGSAAPQMTTRGSNDASQIAATLPTTCAQSQPASAPYVWNFKDTGRTQNMAMSSDSESLMVKSVVYTLLVLVLGGLAIYAGKRFFPRLASPAGKHMSVVESINLGTRHRVHLLKVGHKHILVGTSGDRMTMLGDAGLENVDDPSEQSDGQCEGKE